MVDGKSTLIPAMDASLAGGDIIFLILSAVIYTFLIFVVENLKNRKSFGSIFNR